MCGGMKFRIPGTMGAMETVTPSSAPTLGRAALSASRTASSRSVAGRTTAGRTTAARAAAARSLGSQLERDRLEQRAVRVRQVIHALRERAAARDTDGGAPRPLRAAIEDFGRELAELERRMQRHGTARAVR
jgi:hypothetical protein